jgi:pimeloyl-ACP methyl ester carboxylesterase
MHYLESGPEHGIPVVLIHGNLATSRFYEHLLPAAPDHYRFIVPDMRGFGDTERSPIDATRGLRDWADDAYSLVRALGIERRVHLAGWSTGGGAIATYAMDRPVASLTLIDPVSPYGYGGVRADGNPCYPDYAGSGGGTGSSEFTQRLANGDRSSESPFSPRNVMNSSYWSPRHREPADREDILVDEILKSVTGEDGYPGDFTSSDNWPGVAPGTRGILNALSGRYCSWSGIVDLDPKPPILWTHGTEDIVVADGSAWEMGTLGKMGQVPGWPGEEAFPPQPMVTQIRMLLGRYLEAGGRVEVHMFEGSGHGPHVDAAERWSDLFFGFLDSAE